MNEIFGTPCSYHVHNGETLRYRTFAWRSKHLDNCLNSQAEVLKTIREKFKPEIIFWRMSPEVQLDFETKLWYSRMRLVTYPDLTEEKWLELSYKQEGEETKFV